MCGRFIFFSDDDDERLMEVVQENLPGIKGLNKFNFKRGDVYPSQQFPIIREIQRQPEVTDMFWGYPPVSKKSKSLLINARAETAADKYTFRYDYQNRRCIVLATGFYEWSKDKVKNLFTNDSNLLFIGGLYTVTNQTDEQDSQDRFVILTKQPDATVKPVHNRMPVLIPPSMAQTWLTDTRAVQDIIHNYSVKLTDQAFPRS